MYENLPMEYMERRNCAPALMALWVVSLRWLELPLWSVIWAPNRNPMLVCLGCTLKVIPLDSSYYNEAIGEYCLTLRSADLSRYEAVSVSEDSTGSHCRLYSAKKIGDLSIVGRGLFQADMNRLE